MLRRIIRWFLLLVLAGSLASTILTAAKIAADPAVSPYVAATPAEIVTASQMMLAKSATPEAVSARLRQRLDEYPRNWLALSTLVAFAQERALPLPTDVTDALAIAKEDDGGLYAFASNCTTCATDPGQCPFAQVLICQTPLTLPPPAEIAALAATATKAQSGGATNQIALALAVVALDAERLAPTPDYAATAIRSGAQLAALGNRLQLFSPALSATASDAALDGLNWAALMKAASLADLSAATRVDAFAPLSQVLLQLNALETASNTKTVLHLLPMIDSVADAQGFALAATALGPQLIVTTELLGKDAVIHTTAQVSKTGWTLIAGLVAFWMALAVLVGGWLQRHMLRRKVTAEDDAA